jgi:phage protein D
VVSSEIYYRVSVFAGSAECDLSKELSSLTINEDATRPDQLTAHLSDQYKVFGHALQEGMEIEVDLGTSEDHSVIFRGRLYKVEGSFPESGVPTLRLLAHDRSMAMGLRRRNRPWTDMPLSGIVTTIAADYFMPAKIIINLRGDPEFTGNGVRQQNLTDLGFLRQLADRYGCEMFVIVDDQGEELHFEAQYDIMKSTPEVNLVHGRCDAPNRLLSFAASSDISKIQLPRVFSGIDYETGEPTEVTTAEVEEVGDTEDPLLDENLTAFSESYPERAEQLEGLLDAAESVQEQLREELGTYNRVAIPGFTTQEYLEQRAENQFSTSLHGMRATGTAPGNHRLHAQTAVSIFDVGGRFSGTWYLSQVTHALNQEGYTTELRCQR